MTSAERKSVVASANRLPVTLTVTPSALTDAVIEHTRQLLSHAKVIKVRINSGNRDEAELAGMELAERAGAEFVKRVGFVVLLMAGETKSSQPGSE